MRYLWKGGISFGLVNVPVRLYRATEEKTATFHQVHAADGGRIRYRKVCELDGEEVGAKDIVKEYEAEDGRTAVITDEDLEKLPVTTRHAIDVVSFVPSEQIDPLQLGSSYYVESDPKGGSATPYVLLRKAMESTDRTAVVRVALRQREHLATLRPHGDVLVLQLLLWPDEVREPEGLAPSEKVTVRPQEEQMARSLIETLADDYHPEQFHDEYREALQELIDAKLEGVEPPTEEEREEAGGRVIDLMSALRASIERARAGREPAEGEGTEEEAEAEPVAAGGGGGRPAAGAGRRAPRKKAAARPRGGERPAEEAEEAEGAEEAEEKPAARKRAARKTAPTKAAPKKAAKKSSEKPPSRRRAS
ncbi:non-homologous end joining protein Ku [Allostreptomyces psammosilenae]|uniref:Non-homologous end joining protein Ku n=1 Tax=Allostreptomyces psammosilenae TaxID=1892865 RepID=A0A852ZZI4_9ACTN|nr:Ku protein [Allostreptomyces psammosilenae]NYI03682.1 DNA end-binding protein Ku [Allostreptomyces psammosilenae]